MLSLGIAEFNEERYSTALETLSGIQRGTEHDWRVAYYTGVTQIRLKDFEAAAAALEEARLLNAYDEDIPFALGVTYFKLGNLALAKSYFHSVLEINPDHAMVKALAALSLSWLLGSASMAALITGSIASRLVTRLAVDQGPQIRSLMMVVYCARNAGTSRTSANLLARRGA